VSRPRLLDLFCGAGGCAMGYHRAGFDVTGVDVKPQPRFPFAFVQADALEYLMAHGREFDAVHASPPCQRYSQGTKRWVGRQATHPDLVGPVRDMLQSIGKPWVIENVVGAPLESPTLLCGTMFGLKVFRHRLFEASFLLLAPSHPRHDGSTGAHRGYSTLRSGRNGYVCVAGHNFIREQGAEAMGIDWMGSLKELAQAIPPAYTEFIGRQLMDVVRRHP
jgi:DNA (cytosine-5)-methyltransferase 1